MERIGGAKPKDEIFSTEKIMQDLNDCDTVTCSSNEETHIKFLGHFSVQILVF